LTLLAWIGGALIGSPAFSSAQDSPTWQIGLSYSHLTGDYGEDETTNIDYGALSVKRYYGIGDVTLTVPYLDISAEGVTFVGGQVTPIAGSGGGSGLGDIILKGRYYAVQQVENKDWIALGEIGYTYVGDPSGFDADNRWLYSIGLAYEIDPDITLSGYIDGRTAIFPGNDDPLSILLISELKLSTDLRFDTLLEFGLNDGAPDFGITVGLRKRF
jgi:hypothetical protein